MYNIIQLNDKDLSELQAIAKELGITKSESLTKEQLVYRILDEQAIVGASKKVAATKNSEERKEAQPRKRSRISVKKEGSKVYTATKDKAQKLEANTPSLPAPAPLFKQEDNTNNNSSTSNNETETKATITKTVEVQATETPATTEAPAEKPKAKRGRKPGVKNKATAQETKTIKEVPTPEPVINHDDLEELPELDFSSINNDFIAIEDLPSEKFELPTELLGKFEATKMENNAASPAQENTPKKNQNKQQRFNNPRNNRQLQAQQQASQQQPATENGSYSSTCSCRCSRKEARRKALRI